MKKQPCQTLFAWLKANLGPSCLAPLTGTDARALLAALQIVELYSEARNMEVAKAFGLCVQHMQRSTRPLAFHAIAHVLDWSDRVPLWEAAGLGDITAPLCAYEPGGSAR